MPVSEALYRYTRQLTAAWAWMLAALAVINLLLALCAVPGGVLEQFGYRPWIVVPYEQWAVFANIVNYGIVGGFFVDALARPAGHEHPRRHAEHVDQQVATHQRKRAQVFAKDPLQLFEIGLGRVEHRDGAAQLIIPKFVLSFGFAQA